MNVFKKIVSFFQGDKLDKAIDKVVPIVANIATLIKAATAATWWTQVDDMAVGAMEAILKQKYPSLFSGKHKTSDEVKLQALLVAETLVRDKWPNLNTNQIRTLIELAVAAHKKRAEAA